MGLLNGYKQKIVLFVGFAIASEIIWHYFKKYKDSRVKKARLQLDSPISECLFFSAKSADCRTHANYNVPCNLPTCPVISLTKLIKHISSAKKSLDICVYFLTFNAIVKAIIELHRKNVDIRVITDDESSDNEASQILNMRKAGIKVRSKSFMYLMHHKFAVVDRKLLITGSANWTVQAFYGNYENVLITNQEDLVNCYVNEFDKLWSCYDDGNNSVDLKKADNGQTMKQLTDKKERNFIRNVI